MKEPHLSASRFAPGFAPRAFWFLLFAFIGRAIALDAAEVVASGGSHVMRAVEDAASGQIDLFEGTQPVLRYNYRTIEPGPLLEQISESNRIYARARSDYIHPLYGLDGEELTRDWSLDHPHHRGIYWAWPEVDYGSERGDLHALQRVFARPTGRVLWRSTEGRAEIEAENLWRWEDGEPIVRELVLITAQRATASGRVVDLAFRFEALKAGVTLARRGTEAYGGLNLRLATPAAQVIHVHTDSPEADRPRAWSDLSGVFAGGKPSGLMILQSSANPYYPGDWVQYPELSWCQPAFPRSGTRHALEQGPSLVLRYRLWIHRGGRPADEQAARLWDDFQADVVQPPAFTMLERQRISILDERLAVHGLPWFKEDKPALRRLPERRQASFRPAVWELAQQPSGGRIRFRTDSLSVGITARNPRFSNMHHMASVGESGFDLYVDREYLGSAWPDAEGTIQKEWRIGQEPRMREVTLYLPLYKAVSVAELTLDPDARLERPSAYAIERPILYYGSSITQGGCASNPGGTCQAILERRLDADFVNLGFSGNGLGEPALAEVIGELNPSCIVLDFWANPKPEQYAAALPGFVDILRRHFPRVPILVTSPFYFPAEAASTEVARAQAAKRDTASRFVQQRHQAGDRHIRFVDGLKMLNQSQSHGLVDGVHCNSLGFYFNADGLEPSLRTVLAEVKGESATN